jgi:uncharacterized protein
MRPRAVGCLVLLISLAGAARAETPIPPAPARFVTDRASFLSPTTATALEGKLASWSARTGHQMIVYVDRTTGGVPIEDWAVRAFEAWRVGRKGIDDGLALFLFADDRRLRVEVGYGLEDRVPDLVANRIIDEEMVPRIRAGDHDGAVQNGVDRLMTVVGDAPASATPAARVSGLKMVLGGLALLVFFGLMVTHPGLAWLMMLNIGGRGRGGGFGGGGFGGGGFGGGGFGGGGFSGGGGRSGGGGASGRW